MFKNFKIYFIIGIVIFDFTLSVPREIFFKQSIERFQANENFLKSTERLMNVDDEKKSTNYYHIQNIANLIACLGKVCYKITDFNIIDTNSLNCYNQTIFISFRIIDIYTNNSVSTDGYLAEESINFNMLITSPIVGNICRFIKRYIF